jgi:hypothetical protein
MIFDTQSFFNASAQVMMSSDIDVSDEDRSLVLELIAEYCPSEMDELGAMIGVL